MKVIYKVNVNISREKFARQGNFFSKNSVIKKMNAGAALLVSVIVGVIAFFILWSLDKSYNLGWLWSILLAILIGLFVYMLMMRSAKKHASEVTRTTITETPNYVSASRYGVPITQTGYPLPQTNIPLY